MITQPLQEVQPTEAVEEQVQYWDVPAVVSQNTTATSEVPTEFFELCPEGDVILVATGTREKRPEEESLTGTLLEEELDTELYRAKIRVSSVTLSLASKVFRALFSPRYSEGQAIREASSEDKEIALEDDDPYALTTLCRVLHYAAKLDIAEKLCDNINYFYKVAILADKVAEHRVADATGKRAECKCEKAYCKCDTDEWKYNEILAAYLLDSPKYFKLFTSHLILECDPCPDARERLEDQGRRARDKVIEYLNLFVHYAHCNQKSTQCSELISILMSSGLWPVKVMNMEVSGLLRLLSILMDRLLHSKDYVWQPHGLPSHILPETPCS
ncbi:hypothetical protein BDV97DRAFT_368267 [Delphinella strobiligena]|nr:hypothetical protein BDV97DRAFT_368267 [Delphinella strobiligena]